MTDRFEAYVLTIEALTVRVSRRIGKEIAALLEGEISPAQYLVIRLLGDRDRATVSEISEAMGVTLSAVTSLTDRLQASGLIVRERDDRDRRLVYLRLTEAGKAKLAEINAKRLNLIRRILEPLPEADLEQLVRIFSRVASIVEDQ